MIHYVRNAFFETDNVSEFSCIRVVASLNARISDDDIEFLMAVNLLRATTSNVLYCDLDFDRLN